VSELTTKVLDHGYVTLRNISGPTRRTDTMFDADDVDPAQVARISFDNLDAERTKEQDHKLYEYLMAHLHSTPVEMIETWWTIKVPMAIGEQIIRHRTATINKISGRYTQLPAEWYIPNLESVGLKSASNKQGRDMIPVSELTEEQRHIILGFIYALNKHNELGYDHYVWYLERGIAPELCRFFLQANHYTTFVYKQDLHNLLHFLSLRLDSHSQYENRVVAEAMYQYLVTYLPKSMELFNKYRRL
jgi:thymidylate synthase (FAD)